jgi:hypothetical protein
MLSWLKNQITKWSQWVGDRDLELLLRAKLSGRGYLGDSAQFHYMRLVAIQRPGWLQVFSFNVTTRKREGDESRLVFGLLRQDERYRKTEIELFENAADRHRLFSDWSKDLVVSRRTSL